MSADDLTHVKTKKAFVGLHPLLSEWLILLRNYCSVCDDNPWWYNERASLSVLAGAAWSLGSGWIALEEFATEKRGVVPGKIIEDGKIVKGRCDLYIANNALEYMIEAKQLWQSAGKRVKSSKIGTAMTAAKKDAGNLHANLSDRRMAAVFTIPHLPLGEISSKKVRGKWVADRFMIRERIEAWIQEQHLDDFDAYAYFFPKNNSSFANHKAGKIFPGVLLTMQHCKTGNRRNPSNIGS